MDTTLINHYLGNEKITLIDIGARGGIDSKWDKLSPFLNVVGFEPDKEECARINKTAGTLSYSMECLPFALGENDNTEATLNVCIKPGCSSIYEPNYDFVGQFYFASNMEVVGSFNMFMTTLDDVCDKHNIVPDCIKVDTQGTELDIFKGAKKSLSKVKFIELEVEFNPQYKNQPLFSNVDLYLREQGFMLLGLRRTCWRRVNSNDLPKSSFGGQIIHGDAIYYNANFMENFDSTSIKDILKFCLILSAYKQDDLILYILGNQYKAFNDFKNTDKHKIITSLLNTPTFGPRLLSKILNVLRKRIFIPHVSLRRFIDSMQNKNSQDWHDPDFF